MNDNREALQAGGETRLSAAFRAWLEALAVDPEAATAASMAYEALDAAGRDAWLDALSDEASRVTAPALALYGPLLGIETDSARLLRMSAALAAAPLTSEPPRTVRTLCGDAGAGESVAAIVIPLYLDFVELLICRYSPDFGVISARRGPLLRSSDVWSSGAVRQVDGVELLECPVACVVEGLAHALIADRREGRPAPEPLRTYAFLFTLSVVDLAPPPGVET